jgi:hypothetical protein
MGSTVILLLPPGGNLRFTVAPGEPVRLGQVIARWE